MNQPIDTKITLEIIERMKLAQIGEYRKWEKIIKKIKNDQNLSASELGYFTNFTRIYKNLGASNRSRIFHTRLSSHDIKPKCHSCGSESEFYCNMNDQYFCIIHIVGHDENEF